MGLERKKKTLLGTIILIIVIDILISVNQSAKPHTHNHQHTPLLPMLTHWVLKPPRVAEQGEAPSVPGRTLRSCPQRTAF
jgi:hypothetical protein